MRQLAANALTTLSAARLMPGVPQTVGDELLILLINQASGSIEGALQRELRLQVRTERVMPDGSQQLLLRHYPVTTVERVLQAGSEIDPACYEVEPNTGMLWKDDGWRWTGYPAGLAYDPAATSQNITVEYTAGYVLPKDETEEQAATLPADLEGLALEMVQDACARFTSGGAGLKSFSISDVRWEWSTDVPQAWKDTIERYRRWA